MNFEIDDTRRMLEMQIDHPLHFAIRLGPATGFHPVLKRSARALSFPDVILAQLSLMLLHLALNFGKSHLGAGAGVCAAAGCMGH